MGEEGCSASPISATPTCDPIARFAWQFIGNNSYGGITYGKTATMLITLEKVIGEDTLRQAMHTYFMRYRFTHPTGEDFMKTIEEVSGKDLHWYFNQAVYGTKVLDYEVDDAHSDPLKWWDSLHGSSQTGRRNLPHLRHRPSQGRFYFPRRPHRQIRRWLDRHRTLGRPGSLDALPVRPQSQDRVRRRSIRRTRSSWTAIFSTTATSKKSNAFALYKFRNMWVFASEWLSQLLAWLT